MHWSLSRWDPWAAGTRPKRTKWLDWYTRLEAITGLAESARLAGQYDVQAAINYIDEQRGIRVANNIPPEKECPVCFQNPRNAVFRCGHRVCYECALKLRVFDKCPTCRQDVNRWEVIKIFD